GPRADSSSTRCRVFRSARNAVQGWPNSLLNDPGGATVGPSGSSNCAIRSLVDVLPEEPVTPTTVRPVSDSRVTTCRASAANAASTAAPDPSVSPARATDLSWAWPGGNGGTITAGASTSRAANTPAAPAATAEAAKS